MRRRPPAVAAARDTRPESVLMIAGAGPGEVARALAVTDDDLLRRDDAVAPPSGGPCRLAIVAPNARRLGLARAVVARGVPWRGRNDVWFSPTGLLTDQAGDAEAGRAGRAEPGRAGATTPGIGRIAFLFCGLEDRFTPRVDDVCDHFGLPRPALGDTTALGTHGVASIEVGRVLDAALRRLGIVPDLVGGHSIGEWNAMISAGMLDGTFVDDFIATFDPGKLEVPGVVFGVLGQGAEDAAEIIADLPDVVVTHDNCPQQSIICGPDRGVAIALDRLRARGVLGQTLPFRSGFHSPFLEPYLAEPRARLLDTPLFPPAVPVWSATTAAPYPAAADDIRALAVRHLVEPVRFRQLTERLHRGGVRVFVQVGVGSIAGFVDGTLAGQDHLAVVSNTPKRSGLDQLRRVAAALWAEGAEPRLHLLPCHGGSTGSTGSTRSGRMMRLALGVPTMRLGPQAAELLGPIVSAGPAAAALRPPVAAPSREQTGPVNHPVIAELDAALAQAQDIRAEVVGRWRSAGPAAPALPRRRPPEVPAPLPAVPAPPPAVPATRTVRRTLSVDDLPEVMDHCFYRQPPGWSEVSDRFPVVPMTALLHLMIEHALALVPAGVAVAIRDVRALRWLAVEPPVEVTITSTAAADGTVGVVVEGHARGTVVLAPAYPPPPAGTDVTADLPAGVRLTDEVLPPHQAADLYGTFLFHGPRYQGIDHVDAMAPDGIRGRLTVPTGTGALLDNVGQFYGYWATQYLDANWLILPQSIAELRLYGPPPEAGRRMGATVRIRAVDELTVTADMEVRADDGVLWAHVLGWKDRRFAADDILWPVTCVPEHNTLARPSPDGWVVVRDHWRDTASRELILRHYLDPAERRRFAAHNPRAAREWLLGRIAVKDGVRRWWWDRGAGAIWGIEVRVDDGPSGRPVLGPAGDRPELVDLVMPNAALACRLELAVAIVDASPDIGIHLERIPARPPAAGDPVAAADAADAADEASLDALSVAGAVASAAGAEARSIWLARFRAARAAAAAVLATSHNDDLLLGRLAVDRVLEPAAGAARAVAHRWPVTGPPPRQPLSRPTDRSATSATSATSAETGWPAPVYVRVGAHGVGPRWVALRTVDEFGRPVTDAGAGPAGRPASPGRYVVAWTSPEVERTAHHEQGAVT
ncbi:acyltransferase domain-containing protein [Frankia gtarii]|uniref:acyltransferase domain-containing protein n=1 Tax=Frankia gtarii TaxID=2950102 RepID=UPI0021BF0AEB|nr:acyltransferase domain-containing protein [Frankia gtarii]